MVASPSDPDSFFLEVAGRPLPLFYSAELDSLYLPTETDSFFLEVVGRPLDSGGDYSFFLDDRGLPLFIFVFVGFSSELDTFYYFYSFFLVLGRPLPLLASSSELVDELYSTLLDDAGLPLFLAT